MQMTDNDPMLKSLLNQLFNYDQELLEVEQQLQNARLSFDQRVHKPSNCCSPSGSSYFRNLKKGRTSKGSFRLHHRSWYEINHSELHIIIETMQK